MGSESSKKEIRRRDGSPVSMDEAAKN